MQIRGAEGVSGPGFFCIVNQHMSCHREGREDGESAKLLSALEVTHVISTHSLMAETNNTAQPNC